MVNSTAEPGPSLQTAQILGEGTPDLSRRELGRWTWRQLTSMRMALLLLLLLALGAVPGSLIPQRGVDPSAVARFRLSHPSLSPGGSALTESESRGHATPSAAPSGTMLMSSA